MPGDEGELGSGNAVVDVEDGKKAEKAISFLHGCILLERCWLSCALCVVTLRLL